MSKIVWFLPYVIVKFVSEEIDVKFALIGFVQKDILNLATLGIDVPSLYLDNLQHYISNQMTEDNGYLNVTYFVQSNGQTEEDYKKSAISKTVKDPFCIERTEGYSIDLDLVKQSPIPRYYLRTTNFDIFDDKLEVKPYRVEGEFIAHVVGTWPSFNNVLKTNLMMGFQEFELVGAWTKENLISTVRKILDRGAYLSLIIDLIVCDDLWLDDLKDVCHSFIQSGHLDFV